MSDEDLLGKTCFIPKRLYVLIVALWCTVYGTSNVLYYIVFAFANQGSMTPTHCSGHRCHEVLSCSATTHSSYHFRLCVMVLGCTVFGIKGINAMANKYAGETYNFACWLAALMAVYTFVLIVDGLYFFTCDGLYSYNVIAEAIMWPIHNVPVNSGMKFEVGRMKAYPGHYINELLVLKVQYWYLFLMLLKIAFLCHASWTAFLLADRFHYGIAGMGANFSIEGWRKRLLMRDEVEQVASSTLDMALMTAMDVDWDKDEFQLRRPLRGGMARQWYRGVLSGQTAKAYDGFRDDRQNVLL